LKEALAQTRGLYHQSFGQQKSDQDVFSNVISFVDRINTETKRLRVTHPEFTVAANGAYQDKM
jgi:hypothetical protein